MWRALRAPSTLIPGRPSASATAAVWTVWYSLYVVTPWTGRSAWSSRARAVNSSMEKAFSLLMTWQLGCA